MRTVFRRTWQLAVAALGWLIFGALWWWAFAADGGTLAMRQVYDLLALAIFSLLVTVVTTWWVRYNVGIHRKKGPRKAVPAVDRSYAHDVAGRPVEADYAALQHARFIAIDVQERDGVPVKTYVVCEPPSAAQESSVQTEPEAAA